MPPRVSDSSSYNLSPFYEPGAPPATPILIAQTEIGQPLSRRRLLAQEQIGPRAPYITTCLTSNAKHSTVRRSMTPATGSQSAPDRHTPQKTVPLHRRSVTPTPQPILHTPTPSSSAAAPNHQSQKGVRFFKKFSTSISQNGLPLTRSAMELSEELEPTDHEGEFDEAEGLIPKPHGEAGRPGRGGYNLQEALGWPNVDYSKLKKFVKKATEDCLDSSKSYTFQSPQDLNVVRTLAMTRFPILHDYAQSWPLTDLIRLQLKYSSGRARQRRNDALAEVAKKIVSRR